MVKLVRESEIRLRFREPQYIFKTKILILKVRNQLSSEALAVTMLLRSIPSHGTNQCPDTPARHKKI